jgi:hypothetical protein
VFSLIYNPETLQLQPIHSLDYFVQQAVQKDLYKAAKLKNCPSLHLWNRSIGNATWWGFENCQGLLFDI